MRGSGCDAEGQKSIAATLWNENQQEWVADEFNDFYYGLSVTENLASCSRVWIELGRYLPGSRALLIDEVRFSRKTAFAPTIVPTMSPTITTGPTNKPTIRSDAPTSSLIQNCPPVRSGPVVLSAGSVILGLAPEDILCTVTKVMINNNIFETTIPLTRSYNQNPWEVSAGEIAISIFPTRDLLCYDQGCQVNLPALATGGEYHLKSTQWHVPLNTEYRPMFLVDQN